MISAVHGALTYAVADAESLAEVVAVVVAAPGLTVDIVDENALTVSVLIDITG